MRLASFWLLEHLAKQRHAEAQSGVGGAVLTTPKGASAGGFPPCFAKLGSPLILPASKGNPWPIFFPCVVYQTQRQNGERRLPVWAFHQFGAVRGGFCAAHMGSATLSSCGRHPELMWAAQNPRHFSLNNGYRQRMLIRTARRRNPDSNMHVGMHADGC